jgi:hypothetical protein
MVAKVQITTTVEQDGSVRLSESQIQPAGLRAGDRVRVEIVKDSERFAPPPASAASAPDDSGALDVDALAALPFDEWLKQFRADFPVDQEIDAEELIRQGEDAVADEFLTRFLRDE